MAKDLKTRIEERNRLSQWYNHDRNPVARAVGKVGLWTANAWDVATAPLKSGLSVFGGATAFGAAKGATLGTVAGVMAGLYMEGFGVAGVLVPYALGAAVVGAVVLGIAYGQTKLENHWQASNHQFSDTIAQSLGAVPTRDKLLKKDVGPPPERKPAATPTHPAVDEASNYAAPGFADRENQRRAARQQRGPTILN